MTTYLKAKLKNIIDNSVNIVFLSVLLIPAVLSKLLLNLNQPVTRI